MFKNGFVTKTIWLYVPKVEHGCKFTSLTWTNNISLDS